MGSAVGQANAKGLRQKQAPMDEARLIDSMAQPGGHVPLRRDVSFGELFGAVEQGLEGDDLIRRAMDQQHRRRLAPDVAGGGAGEMLGADQHAGKAEDGGGRALAAQAHMQRHHGSLAEADERELAVVKARRLKLGVPGPADWGSDQLYALEADLDLLGAIDFHKGCFIGQEIASRMKRRGQIKSRTLPIGFDGPAPPHGTEIRSGEHRAGEVLSGRDGRALALIRLDRIADGDLSAAGRPVKIEQPGWLTL